MFVSVYVCVCVCVCLSVDVCMCMHECMCVCVHVGVCAGVCRCVHACELPQRVLFLPCSSPRGKSPLKHAPDNTQIPLQKETTYHTLG